MILRKGNRKRETRCRKCNIVFLEPTDLQMHKLRNHKKYD